MGDKFPHRKVKKRWFSHKTEHQRKFLLKGDDMVYNKLLKVAEEAAQGKETEMLPFNEDLPEMGQLYCLHCDRYFANETVRRDHFKLKLHKKWVKQMNGPAPHTQLDAKLAAGMGAPDNGLKFMS